MERLRDLARKAEGPVIASIVLTGLVVASLLLYYILLSLFNLNGLEQHL